MPRDTDNAPICLRCGTLLQEGAGQFYVVKIEAYADPSPPQIEHDAQEDLKAAYEQALRDAATMSERELMDGVHRRLTIHLCTPCYRVWIENPAG